ncbi:MAG: 50S ribosomal protein L4 [Sumerlaeia bacterium]
MPQVTLKTMTGSEAGSIDLADSVFAAEPNEVVVREMLNAFMANQRQGTHSTKTRGMVSGGGRKPWKQKGTGRARQGSIRSAQWRGGAIIFGPQPRDYREKTNKKKRRLAFRSVLSARATDGALHVVDSLDFTQEPKTRRVVDFLGKLGIDGQRVLIVTKESNASLLRSARNLPYVDVAVANAISIYDLLIADAVVMTKDAAEFVQETFQ